MAEGVTFGAAGVVAGPAVAVIGRTLVALVLEDPASRVVEQVRAAASGCRAVDDLLDELAAFGIGGLPSLVLVAPEPPGLRVITRGSAIAWIGDRETLSVLVDAADARTWTDRVVNGSVATLQFAGEQVDPGPFVVTAGAVPASRVDVALDPLTDAGAAAPVSSAPPVATPTSSDRPPPAGEAPPIEEPSADSADDPAEELPPPKGSGSPRPLESDRTIAPHETIRPTPDAVPPPIPSVNDYDALFGATQFRLVEDAAVRAQPDDADHAPSAGAPDAGAGGATVTGAPPESPDEEVSVGGSDRYAASGAAVTVGDHDGLTMTLGQLQALRRSASNAAAGAGAGAPPPGIPMVHAVKCPAGHLNPTHASTCRVCAVALGTQEQITVPRPVLGRLVISTGGEADLTGPLLVGRAPRLDGSFSGQPPELVVVQSPEREVSSNHLEVRIEGWQVLVVDLGSTNGTTVRLPSRPPQRLRSGEPFPITPGSVVSLADEVELMFEVTA